jgi:hypothetical protein
MHGKPAWSFPSIGNPAVHCISPLWPGFWDRLKTGGLCCDTLLTAFDEKIIGKATLEKKR